MSQRKRHVRKSQANQVVEFHCFNFLNYCNLRKKNHLALWTHTKAKAQNTSKAFQRWENPPTIEFQQIFNFRELYSNTCSPRKISQGVRQTLGYISYLQFLVLPRKDKRAMPVLKKIWIFFEDTFEFPFKNTFCEILLLYMLSATNLLPLANKKRWEFFKTKSKISVKNPCLRKTTISSAFCMYALNIVHQSKKKNDLKRNIIKAMMIKCLNRTLFA